MEGAAGDLAITGAVEPASGYLVSDIKQASPGPPPVRSLRFHAAMLLSEAMPPACRRSFPPQALAWPRARAQPGFLRVPDLGILPASLPWAVSPFLAPPQPSLPPSLPGTPASRP